ncbi:MAG: hypothetical protein KDA22_00405 [Phycisphaerales bacterium]|nr:hypothetical protein [Phycisphaerales bacterium]
MTTRFIGGIATAAVALSAATSIAETFDEGTQGWLVVTMCFRPGFVDPASPILLLPCCPGGCPATQGCEVSVDCGNEICQPMNPGGYLEFPDPDGSCGAGHVQYWEAPLEIVSQLCGAPEGLHFDLADLGLGTLFEQEDVILDGAGMRLVFDMPPIGAGWTTYDIPLAASTGWTHDGPGGARATDRELAAVLQAVEALYIRAEHRFAPDVAQLDNVTVSVQPAGPLPADLNRDGSVNGADLGVLLSAWGTCPAPCCLGDLDGDGAVNGADLGLLLAVWTG